MKSEQPKRSKQGTPDSNSRQSGRDSMNSLTYSKLKNLETLSNASEIKAAAKVESQYQDLGKLKRPKSNPRLLKPISTTSNIKVTEELSMGSAQDVKKIEKKKMVSALNKDLKNNVKQMEIDGQFSESLMQDINDAFSSSNKTMSELALQKRVRQKVE